MKDCIEVPSVLGVVFVSEAPDDLKMEGTLFRSLEGGLTYSIDGRLNIASVAVISLGVYMLDLVKRPSNM